MIQVQACTREGCSEMTEQKTATAKGRSRIGFEWQKIKTAAAKGRSRIGFEWQKIRTATCSQR